LLEVPGLDLFSRRRVSEAQLEEPAKGQAMIQVVIPSGSFLEDVTLEEANFRERYDATVLGLNPLPFAITVMLAGSTAFLTPVGNHTNLMVYGPGGYRFGDFFRVGAPLQLLLAVVTPVAVSWFWPLVGG
jgi:hypothetical protein